MTSTSTVRTFHLHTDVTEDVCPMMTRSGYWDRRRTDFDFSADPVGRAGRRCPCKDSVTLPVLRQHQQIPAGHCGADRFARRRGPVHSPGSQRMGRAVASPMLPKARSVKPRVVVQAAMGVACVGGAKASINEAGTLTTRLQSTSARQSAWAATNSARAVIGTVSRLP
jgi:hypothetical protein